jgi:formylmethanofuran dehydrogenase subunit B
MTAKAEGEGLGERAASEFYQNVTCPFCGLLCDDLEIARTGTTLKVLKNGCPRAAAGFQRVLPAAKPLVRGKEVGVKDAVEAAAALIKAAELPLYGGMATDVDGVRAMMSLADRSCGVVDHVLSETQYRNLKVLQSSGWIMSTLTETRNRADLIVIVGSDVHKLHGRFFERIVCAPETMFESVAQKRTVVFIGEGLDTSAATGPRIAKVMTLPCSSERLTEVLGVLQARLRGALLQAHEAAPPRRTGLLSALLPHLRGSGTQAQEIAGVKLSDIDAVAEKCKAARYGVLVWAPPALNLPQADLAVHLISEIVKDLNVTTRFAGLSLGGNEGAPSAASVAAWQTGYPLRLSYANGRPEYDSYRYSIGRMLAENEGDLLVWVSSFTPDLGPPMTRIPTIVLGTPGLRLSQPPDVFIPIGTPGIDHAGSMVRCDNVVSLPLKSLDRSRLPRAADVLAAVEAAL